MYLYFSCRFRTVALRSEAQHPFSNVKWAFSSCANVCCSCPCADVNTAVIHFVIVALCGTHECVFSFFWPSFMIYSDYSTLIQPCLCAIHPLSLPVTQIRSVRSPSSTQAGDVMITIVFGGMCVLEWYGVKARQTLMGDVLCCLLVTQKYMLTQVLKLRGLWSHRSVWGVVVLSSGRDTVFSNVACCFR